ncbi:MAG: hypothetical protein O7D32_04580 [bacterium]|nr:hypothetical protein [bacterium]
MKIVMAGLMVVVLISSLALNAYAEDKPDEGKKSDDPSASNPEDTPAKPRPHMQFAIYSTVYNTYNRGNLDDWFAEQTNDPGRQVDQGSPAYFSFEGAVLFPMKPDQLWVGASFEMVLPADRALWGTQTFFGGRTEIVLAPWMFSIGMPIRYRMGTGDFFATATPTMLFGWVTGDYSDGTNFLDFTASPGFGFGMAVGGEAIFAEHFGVDLKIGFRALKTDLVYEDPTSGTGFSQPLLNNGDPVQVDLGGTYMAIGVSLHR